jgi:type II secretory pathway predicted ATPase ExeA
MTYFGFENRPFSKNMGTSSLFIGTEQEEVLNRLLYVIDNQLFATLTGECGTGKSTVLRKLNDVIDKNKYEILYLADSKLTPRHFYNGLLTQLGKNGSFFRGDSRRMLHQEIENTRCIRGRSLAVVVDEAHLLNTEMLEEIRFTLNFRMDSISPLALVLSGQTELEEKLEKKSATAIRQRVDFRCRLLPFSLTETEEYIIYHMTYAGIKRQIFSESAIKEIFSVSSGLARIINKICINCLMFCSINNQEIIDGDNVKKIVESELK